MNILCKFDSIVLGFNNETPIGRVIILANFKPAELCCLQQTLIQKDIQIF